MTTTPEKIASRRDPWDPASVEADNSGRERLLADAQAELDRQIGLTRVKEQIEAYRAATQMAKVRAARGMKVAQTSKHMIFTGPPGTGKTTIARVVANILAGLGVIAEPKLVEIVAQGLRRRVRGPVRGEDRRTIDRAVGGVLFIDEAYTLVQERDGRADPFGTEALDTLLARMENDRDRLVVIIAGYSADIDRLLETNDGLRSRFSTRIEFDSYSPDEIVDIAKVHCRRPMIRRSSEEAAKQSSGGRHAAEPASAERQAGAGHRGQRPLRPPTGRGRRADPGYAAGPVGRLREPRRGAAQRDQRRRHGGGDRRRARRD